MANNEWTGGDDACCDGGGGGSAGAVSSVFGRTGAVVAALSDYDASQVDNDSLATGATVADALSNHTGTLSANTAAIALNTSKVSNEEYSTLLFGADLNGTGRFALANGKSSDADDTSRPKTRQPCVAAGSITRVGWFSQSGHLTTTMKIHVDGVVADTFMLGATSGAASVSASVSAGSYVELEYDAGTAPNQSTWCLTLELT
jgi:hypothetical protein